MQCSAPLIRQASGGVHERHPSGAVSRIDLRVEALSGQAVSLVDGYFCVKGPYLWTVFPPCLAPGAVFTGTASVCTRNAAIPAGRRRGAVGRWTSLRTILLRIWTVRNVSASPRNTPVICGNGDGSRSGFCRFCVLTLPLPRQTPRNVAGYGVMCVCEHCLHARDGAGNLFSRDHWIHSLAVPSGAPRFGVANPFSSTQRFSTSCPGRHREGQGLRLRVARKSGTISPPLFQREGAALWIPVECLAAVAAG